jgi:hypothetical protein
MLIPLDAAQPSGMISPTVPRDRLAGRLGALDGAADDLPVRGIGLTWSLPR